MMGPRSSQAVEFKPEIQPRDAQPFARFSCLATPPAGGAAGDHPPGRRRAAHGHLLAAPAPQRAALRGAASSEFEVVASEREYIRRGDLYHEIRDDPQLSGFAREGAGADERERRHSVGRNAVRVELLQVDLVDAGLEAAYPIDAGWLGGLRSGGVNEMVCASVSPQLVGA
jgi:hypothetical protein